MCRVGLAQGSAQAAQWAEKLAFLAARTGMRELVVRAHLYRGRLGQEGALEAARLLAAEIDNPALDSPLAADPSQAVACLL